MGTDVRVAVANKVITTGDVGSDVDITFPSGFGTPKFCLFFANYQATVSSSVFADHYAVGIGMAGDDGYETCLFSTAKDNVTNSECGHAHREDDDIVIVMLDPGSNTAFGRLDRASGGLFGTDKITINVNNLDANVALTVMAFAGNDVTVSNCSGTVPGATPGDTADYTHNLNTNDSVGVNYLVFGVNDDGGAGSYTSGNRSIFSYSMATITSSGSAFDYACTGMAVDHNYSSGCRMAYGLTNKADTDTLFVSIPNQSAATWKTDTFKMSAATNDKFTLERIAGANTTADFRFMVVDLGDLTAEILECDSITTDASDYTVTGASFAPQASLTIYGKANAYGTNYVSGGNANITAIGVAAGDSVASGKMVLSSVDEYSIGTMGDDGNTTTDHLCWHADRQIFGREVVSGTGTTLWHAGPTEFTSDGWEIAAANITSYNADTDKWLSLVIEQQPSAAGGVPSGLSLLGVGT